MITISLIVNFIGIAALVFQCGIWLFIFGRLAIHKEYQPANFNVQNKLPGLSILICARNEATNLSSRLPSILEQAYSGEWEVIVVNDRSTDGSDEVLKALQIKHPERLKIVTISQNEEQKLPGKKAALGKGISSSKHDILLLTDADCSPASPHWAANMVYQLTSEKEIVLSYGAYELTNGLLNKIVQYETQWTATQYLSLALSGFPYMGVGRNLLYRKRLFDNFVPSENYKTLLSGDDDLFVNAVANSDNVAICTSPDSFTYSAPSVTWTDWFRQKSRHVSAGAAYNWTNKVILGAISLSHIITYAILIIPLFCCTLHCGLWILFIVRISSMTFVSWKIAQKLKTELNIGELLLLDFVYLLYYPIFFSSLFYSLKSIKVSTWKKNT